MIARLSRRLALGLVAAFVAGGGAIAAISAREPDDMALGNPQARVTVIEYASAGCPHCAKWANENYAAFKARFIDTGKVRYVVRELLFGERTVAAAGFMTARCAGPARYFAVIEAIYRRQASMFEPNAEPQAVLRDIAKTTGGMTDAAFTACVTDQKALAALNARSERHEHVDKVDSTPTFFVNGKQLEGEVTLADLSAAIRAASRRR